MQLSKSMPLDSAELPADSAGELAAGKRALGRSSRAARELGWRPQVSRGSPSTPIFLASPISLGFCHFHFTLIKLEISSITWKTTEQASEIGTMCSWVCACMWQAGRHQWRCAGPSVSVVSSSPFVEKAIALRLKMTRTLAPARLRVARL